jgi:hypothetical protein
LERPALLASFLLLALILTAAASAELVQRGHLRVKFDGKLTPSKLPRSGLAPVRVSVSAKVTDLTGGTPPPMRQMSIAINKNGRLDTTGLPLCHLEDIQPATTDDAIAGCRRSLVGEGNFFADVPPGSRAPFPSEGKIYAFNGEIDGKRAILAHVYGVKPAPASFTMAFVITQSKGAFGTTLKADLPKSKPGNGSITGIYLSLGKTFKAHGKRHSYFSGSCPTPKGISRASFKLARSSIAFQGGPTVSTDLNRSCTAKG